MNAAVGRSPVLTESDHVLALLRHVEESVQGITEAECDFAALHQSVMLLEKYIFSFDREETSAANLWDSIAPETRSKLNHVYRTWESKAELEFIQRLIRGESALSDYLLYKRFDGLVRRELALINGTKLERILLIGCGPLPISAIQAHFQTGFPIDCIGRDPEAVIISEEVLEACDLKGLIRVFSENDGEYNLSDYDLIVVELQAEPKKDVLKRLRKRCRPCCQILYRTSLGLRRLLYPATLDNYPRGFHIKGWQIAQSEQIISTCLLESAKSAAASARLEWLREIDSQRGSQLLGLMNRTLEEETTIGFPGPIDDRVGAVLMQQLNADVIAGRRHVLVAEKDGMIVGQLILTPNSTPNHRHMVELTRGTIDRSFRGGGLALRAFEEVATKCEELGRDVICLDVRAGTMAAIWWQHFGFKPYGLLSDYSRVGDQRYAGLFLTQSIDELKRRLAEIATSTPPTSLSTN